METADNDKGNYHYLAWRFACRHLSEAKRTQGFFPDFLHGVLPSLLWMEERKISYDIFVPHDSLEGTAILLFPNVENEFVVKMKWHDKKLDVLENGITVLRSGTDASVLDYVKKRIDAPAPQ